VNNPNWNDSLFKGEAYDMTADGQHACGRNSGMAFPSQWYPGWISNPDGTFTLIPPPAHFQDFVDPFRISDDGKTVVGRVGNPAFGAIPFFWNEGTGSQDIQLFLVQQGLDELFFWNLLDVHDVSADGTIMAGRGINPDGRVEGFIVDIEKLWVCHAPPGNPAGARTLGINLGAAGDHVAHGDFMGTCEFLESGGLSRATELRDRLNSMYPAVAAEFNLGNQVSSSWGDAETTGDTPAPPQIEPTNGEGSNDDPSTPGRRGGARREQRD
jgi:hypothetical protein